jgi:hypothetical protein
MFHSPEFTKAEVSYRIEKLQGSGSKKRRLRHHETVAGRKRRKAGLRAKEAWSL